MSILNPSHRGAKRRSADEVKPLMLETAVELIHREGLTVSLQHISMDALAGLAGISRSAVYRAWPNREDFFDDLLMKLCYEPKSHPMVFDGDTLTKALEVFGSELATDPHVLDTPEGRRAVMVEMCRTGATVNYDNLASHTAWRTWIALAATALSYPDEQKARLQAAIAENEVKYTNGMAKFYEHLGEVLGRKIREQFRSDTASGRPPYAYLAATGAATMEGLVLRSVKYPQEKVDTVAPVADAAKDVDPFDTGRERNWNAAALTFTAMFLGMTEPVPEKEFSLDMEQLPRRIEELKAEAMNMVANAEINASDGAA